MRSAASGRALVTWRRWTLWLVRRRKWADEGVMLKEAKASRQAR